MCKYHLITLWHFAQLIIVSSPLKLVFEFVLRHQTFSILIAKLLHQQVTENT
jgi:hypothetical protein